MSDTPLAAFLLPEPFARPRLATLAYEGAVVAELGRAVVTAASHTAVRTAVHTVPRTVTRTVTTIPRAIVRRPPAPRPAAPGGDPVLLVPGFMAGDATLALMAGTLRERGFRTYRSRIRANIGCTYEAATTLEARLEEIVGRRGTRAQIVGHSLGGMIARGIAVRRPDLVSGIVTMGSPMLAPAAHHAALSWGVETLVRLSRLGVPGLMAADCVAGACARQSFEESRLPVPEGVGFTAVYSKRDGVVDWRACVDPLAVPVEVTTSHCGMAFDPHVVDLVTDALRRQAVAAQAPVVRIA